MKIDKRRNGMELLAILEYSEVIGDPDRNLKGPAPLLEAGPDDFSFCKKKGIDAISLINRSKAGFLLVHESVLNLISVREETCLVAMNNPRLGFLRCMNAFFPKYIDWTIDPSAMISESAVLPDRLSVGPMAIIGKDVVIGEGSIIGPRAYIHNETMIGKEVNIQAGAIIGCDGQGFERNEEGKFEKFPQMGRVVLEDDVEIGANSTIVRGALPGNDTLIGEGTKIGHLVDIGKNVKIGRDCLISAGVVVCGSVNIGDNVWLAPGCVIRQKIVIGKGSTVGLGGVVVADVEEGTTVAGVPARPMNRS